MKRRLLVLVVGLSVFAGVWAAAASLSVNSSTLAAGTQTVGGCTATVNVAYTLAFSSGDYRVQSAVVSGITPAAACSGKTLSVTLRDGANNALGSGTVTAGATGTETVAISGTPLASSVAGVNVVFNG